MYISFIALSSALLSRSLCATWPYDRYYAQRAKAGHYLADTSRPEMTDDPRNDFVHWLHHVTNTQDSGAVRSLFVHQTIPKNVTDLDELYNYLDLPAPGPDAGNHSFLLPPMIPHLPSDEAGQLFRHLNYSLDPRCTVDRSRWWYRTYDGSCNWLKQDEISEGQIGTAKVRDYNQHYYADGISTPREGPNPRAVSNAFFRRNATIYYEHTPLLLGLIEFIMHDITYSMDSSVEYVDVKVPPDEDYFEPNTTFRVWRTAAVPGTGKSTENPRENVNMASTWLDISSLYGSTAEVARALRSFQGGKLLTQELKTRGQSTYASYLPFNGMNVPMRTRPGVDPRTLFAGGDPRTNEDWLMLGVHTLLLREHNRLCDIVAKQHPEYDDERIYQTVRLVMSAKYALIANSYQMAYWTDEMPWPRDDGFPLYRQMYGESVVDINPMNTYPWPLVMKAGKPMVVSAEMAIVYRFHEFIIPEFPIKDATNHTLWNQSVFDTGFNAQGFIDAGLENILRGTVGTHIPNFKSGVDESFRSAGKYRGKPFDVVTWSLVHEREQGLPTFNVYFRAYNAQHPKVVVPIRNTFEDFSSDPATVAKLKKLYTAPDDVDLVVGVQLDEEMFPGTTVPKSALIISLFSLFGMGNSDRFSIGFAVTRCFLVDKPWDCKPTNALEELLWAPKPHPDFPNLRWLDSFWLTELDLQAHGTNLLWRLITENSDIKCVQQKPLFPADPVTNPVLCVLSKTSFWSTLSTILLAAVEGVLTLYQQNPTLYDILAAGIFGLLVIVLWYWFDRNRGLNVPPVFRGWPVLGQALAFQKDPKSLLLRGFDKYGQTPSKVFGLQLASLTHFVISDPIDLKLMEADNPYEVKFSLHAFLSAINAPLIVHKDNFESDLHTKLIRIHLGSPEVVSQFGQTIMRASDRFFQQRLSSTVDRQFIPKFVPILMDYITTVVGCCIIGDEVFDHPDLLKIFIRFNDHAIQAMGISALLPSFLQCIAGWSVNKDFKSARKILLPIIAQRRRANQRGAKSSRVTFLDFVLDVVDDDERAADLASIVTWQGLTNLQATFTSLVMDIINAPRHTKDALTQNLASLDPADLSTFPVSPQPDPNNPWTPLRAAMFESIRLSGPIIGPARICQENVTLPSSMASKPQVLPKSQVATLSAYHTHRSPSVYGEDAATWVPTRFLRSDPEIGSPKFVAWGLTGPHSCPGQWFAQECLLVMTKCLLGKYDIVPYEILRDDEKYIYSAGSVTRKDVGVAIRERDNELIWTKQSLAAKNPDLGKLSRC